VKHYASSTPGWHCHTACVYTIDGRLGKHVAGADFATGGIHFFPQKIVFRRKTPDFINLRIPDRKGDVFFGATAGPGTKPEYATVDDIVATGTVYHDCDPLPQFYGSLGIALRRGSNRRRHPEQKHENSNAESSYMQDSQFTSAMPAQ